MLAKDSSEGISLIDVDWRLRLKKELALGQVTGLPVADEYR